MPLPRGACGCHGVRRGVDAGLDCEVRPYSMAAWRRRAKDPGALVEQWFADGSPLGITRMPERRGISRCIHSEQLRRMCRTWPEARGAPTIQVLMAAGVLIEGLVMKNPYVHEPLQPRGEDRCSSFSFSGNWKNAFLNRVLGASTCCSVGA